MAEFTFDSMKNGYNRYQVDDKMSQLLNEIEDLHKKLDLYSSRLEAIEKQSAEYKEKYLSLVSELRIKEKAAEDIARISLREANVIVQTAHDNADVIVREALTSARLILLEINKLGEETGEIKGRMLTQLKKLDKALNDFELPPMPNIDLLED